MTAEWAAVLISALCTAGSVISFLLSRREKKKAKESEYEAKRQAEVATEANRAAKNYYDLLVAEEKPKQMKYQVIRYLKRNKNRRGTKDIAEGLKMDVDQAHDLLLDMLWVDGMLGANGNFETVNDQTIWEPINRR